MTTTDNFTEAARIIDAHRQNERWVGDGVKIECVCGHTSHATYDFSGPITEDKNNHRDAERMHAVHVAQVLTAQEPTDAAQIIDEHRTTGRWVGDGVRVECTCGHVSPGSHPGGPQTAEDNAHRDADRKHAAHVADMLARAARRDEEKR